jgi:hypothetical protein
MRLIAKIRLTEPCVPEEIFLFNKMHAFFSHAHEQTANIDWYSVYADAVNPYVVTAEVKLNNADGFADAIHAEKSFDCLHKFFDMVRRKCKTPLLNYIEQMCIYDGSVSYEIPSHCLTLPSAEDACIDLTAELDCYDDMFSQDFVAIWIRRKESDTDIILPIYPRTLCETTNNTVELSADTYDDSSERLSPDVYRPVLDVIDDLVTLKSPCEMMAIHTGACCGDEIDLSEATPIKRLCLSFSRHSKNYNLVLDSKL